MNSTKLEKNSLYGINQKFYKQTLNRLIKSNNNTKRLSI